MMNYMMDLFTRILKRLPLAQYPYKPFMIKHKCIFLHIPKNAGTSILTAFDDEGVRRHIPWIHFHRANSARFKQYFKFTVIREPISRLYSAYNYLLNGGNQSSDDLALSEYIKQNSKDFNSFIMNVLCSDLIMQHELLWPQYLFIYDRQLNLKVDKVLKLESLASDWHCFAKQKGFPIDLPFENKSDVNRAGQQLDLINILNSSAKNKISDLYHNDFKLLKYTM
ncbi:sulfotransferase family protein [Pseudoalteromonas sp. C2R02]|uniref:sulfotransferase family 2 domain-containing protein n=1 Tax=Pseudoalteromonas sp. C2R02 TaxID=2841565 RepID=UPI001C09CFEE|nr:sulfotransferase family 2 domain-containing protein [Pseudoalteromonas sp. C2R02]MBU2972635.1 sulfotransferase family protein [Pseudoalteromonas sp. C2R02]